MRCEKGLTAMKRRWKRIFAGAAPSEDLPAVKTFRYATSGMGIEAFNRYQIKDTARGRFHNEQ